LGSAKRKSPIKGGELELSRETDWKGQIIGSREDAGKTCELGTPQRRTEMEGRVRPKLRGLRTGGADNASRTMQPLRQWQTQGEGKKKALGIPGLWWHLGARSPRATNSSPTGVQTVSHLEKTSGADAQFEQKGCRGGAARPKDAVKGGTLSPAANLKTASKKTAKRTGPVSTYLGADQSKTLW